MDTDLRFMSRALQLAWRGLGYTAPNPAVGALLVKDGRVIGEGYHHRAGEAHAEVAAIESATESVRGATLYCTLEPCCHEGPAKRTPPCTRRIIAEGIARVVVASLDPNPEVDGRGLQALRNAGVAVSLGPLTGEASRLNEAFAAAVRLKRPFVHLKAAQTLDGYLAAGSGDSRWITDGAARAEAHRLRAISDAVLVGAGTVRHDDPALTVRHVRGRQPLRVVLGGRRALPEDARLFTDEFAACTIVYRPAAAEVEVDLDDLLSDLRQRGVTSLLVEGGSRVLSSFLARGLWDKFSLFFGPQILGGGIRTVCGLGIDSIDKALELKELTVEPIGSGFVVRGYRDPEALFGKPVEAGTEGVHRCSDHGRPSGVEVDCVYGNR